MQLWTQLNQQHLKILQQNEGRESLTTSGLRFILSANSTYQSNTALSWARVERAWITSCWKGCFAAAASLTSIPNPGASATSQCPFSVFKLCCTTSQRHGTSVSISSWIRKLGV